MNFQKQFDDVKKLNLPASDFVVVSSGALSVRGLRESNDIDIIVTQSLWDEMIQKFKVGINDWGVENLQLEDNIEILNPKQSIFGNSRVVLVEDIFEKADVFDGIKFINLEHLRAIKLKLGREKDIQDVKLIDDFVLGKKSL